MKSFAVEKQKHFQVFLWVYNIGLIITLGFMTARGIPQLLVMPFPNFGNHIVGGLAGIGHIILTVGLGFLFHALIKSAHERSDK